MPQGYSSLEQTSLLAQQGISQEMVRLKELLRIEEILIFISAVGRRFS